MKTGLSSIFLFLLLQTIIGQRLNNPGFEDHPQDATMPQGWLECSEGTTPDILPGFWGVTTLPHEGNSYIGLITRKDASFESIGQRIYPALERNTCYTTSIALCKSRKYVGYSKSIQIRMYLGKERCTKDQLIFESPLIKHKKWEDYLISFESNFEAHFLIIEVYAEKKGKKGHVLMDQLGPIELCAKAALIPE